MRRMASVMAGGIAMASIMGVLLIWWLSLDQGSGFVGFLFTAGMLVGIAVFAGGAAEAAADLKLEDRPDVTDPVVTTHLDREGAQ